MKVLIIGIDGLDSILLEKWEDVLPNFKRLKDGEKQIKICPTFPIDSPSVWASIYTGLTPTNHEILSVDDYDVSLLRGRTFWDIASRHGKKVCIINPFLAYPAWQVKGVMVSGPPFYTKSGASAYPDSILEKYTIPHMGGVLERYPVKNELRAFYERMRKITLNEADFGLKILKDYDWDLGFICFITLDGIEHFFWRYFDENDPTFPGNNPYEDAVKNFYQLYDEIVGEYTKLIDYDFLIVLSDHGHGMRNIKLANINETLRKAGYLKSNTKNSFSYLMSIIKFRLLDFIYKHNLDDIALKITRIAPRISKNVQKSSFSIDFENSLAYLSDLHGMNPGGGIEINLKREAEYEQLRTEIIKEISELKDPKSGKKIVEWICRREELYSGKYISRFPDIVFELKSEYGVNWDVYTPLVTDCYAHKIISGGHTRNAVFIIKGAVEGKMARSSMTSVDVAPTVLDLLRIEENFNFDGSSLFVEW